MTENHTINMQTAFDKLKGTKNMDALLCVHIMCESINSNIATSSTYLFLCSLQEGLHCHHIDYSSDSNFVSGGVLPN